MKYFLDTEFIETPEILDLLSVALACEDGRTYTAAVAGVDETRAHPWVREHVLPLLPPPDQRKVRGQIRAELEDFLIGDDIEFWGYYPSTDFVVFYRLWGTLLDLPDRFPKYIHDLKTYARYKGIAKLRKPTGVVHRALDDAIHILKTYQEISQ